jgi:hypothetical protein
MTDMKKTSQKPDTAGDTANSSPPTEHLANGKFFFCNGFLISPQAQSKKP